VERIGIGAFFLGGIPQAVKVFGMRGILGTKFFVGILLAHFSIVELFRLIAGSRPHIVHRPMPAIVFAKSINKDLRRVFLLVAMCTSTLCSTLKCAMILYSELEGALFGVTAFIYLELLVILIGMASFRVLSKYQGFIAVMATCTPRDEYLKPISRVRARIVGIVADLFVLSPNLVKRHFTSTLLYIILFPTFVVVGTHVKPVPEVFVLAGLWYLLEFAGMIFVVICFLLLYRLLFMGSLSRIPRHLCGLEGSWAEFISGLFTLVNLLACFLGYYRMYNSTNTYKPDWADKLG
jgi:hypothetical protein